MCFQTGPSGGPYVPPATKQQQPAHTVQQSLPKPQTRGASDIQRSVAVQAVSVSRLGPSLGPTGDGGIQSIKRVNLGL